RKSLVPFPVTLQITLRPCRHRDLKLLEWYGLFTAHRRIIRSAYRRQQRGGNLMLLAEVNGVPVGQVWVDLCRSKSETTPFLWALRVIPWLQGLGIGTRLLEAAEAEVRQRGFTCLELGVEKPNRRARKLYERLGYRVVGQLQDEYSYRTPQGRSVHVKTDEFLMRKQLPRKTVNPRCSA
ncbi:MAG TPA: GNAT family N-acetyltransferase, partial [Candidatus Sulfotelmatobacter sp.]|nr:GNAT family N-acetyltransferase [Candidatus Sulfotelmatobacter sp.]